MLLSFFHPFFSVVNAALSCHQDPDAFEWLQYFLTKFQLSNFQIISINQLELSLPHIRQGHELFQHWQYIWVVKQLLESQRDDDDSMSKAISCSHTISAHSYGVVLSLLVGAGRYLWLVVKGFGISDSFFSRTTKTIV